MALKTQKQVTGTLGEDLACRFLMKHGFEIVERNYWQKCGEIDIIAKNKGILHFIEVKSVSCENINNVSDNGYRPEDNLHSWKLERLKKTIQVYLNNKSVSSETVWKFDVITVYIDTNNKVSRVNFLENIIL
ncbi:MAG: YraN family protein [Candidatus Taylorbacteria bacterium]|nr:YraN family protein [Candidatus Taylorbacteria bacterium]